MKKTVLLLVVCALFVPEVRAQNLQKQLSGKKYSRVFYAVGFKHKASYQFYPDKVVYKVDGFFVTDTYDIVGKYYYDRFVGKDPETGEHYILHIKVISPDKIMINKEGVDPRYQSILSDKPVKGWHEYKLTK